jgi:hypothetical protein
MAAEMDRVWTLDRAAIDAAPAETADRLLGRGAFAA